ncbi:methionine synthase [Anaerobacterium chartisolvens]|nr:methionine synthase [Anaerobacterium chartisolvens]
MEAAYSRIKYFESIPSTPKKNMILTRIGYKKGVTELDEHYMKMLEDGIRLGEALCKPMGAYTRVPVQYRDELCVRLEGGIELQSGSLSKLLCSSGEVVLMGATVGKEVCDRIEYEMANNNAAMAVIIDSVASQTADSCLDWMVHFLNSALAREGIKLTRHRYSPGYGDLALLYQKELFNALRLERLDMSITEKYMLVPEKSVIAIAGIEGRGFENG